MIVSPIVIARHQVCARNRRRRRKIGFTAIHIGNPGQQKMKRGQSRQIHLWNIRKPDR